MRNVGILINRDFTSRVKTGSYIITTILGVLVIVVLAFIPVAIDWMESRFEPTDAHLLLMDKTNAVTESAEHVIAQYYQGVENISIAASTGSALADAVAQMDAENKTGVLAVEYDEEGNLVYTLHTRQSTNMNMNSTVQRIINQINLHYNANKMGLSHEDVMLLTQDPYLHVKTLEPVGDGELEEGDEVVADSHIQSLILAYLLLFILYMALILYGQMVAQGVAEEKSSRIMEIMVSVVKPMQLMIGKIIGIGTLGLVQFAIWIGTGAIVISMKNLGLSIGDIPIGTLLWFALFFILGYLFYATIFAAAGALVSRVEEVQQVITILMMGLIAGFIIAYMSFMNPNSSLATVASMIPLLSPMVMFARVTLTNPPAVQIITSIALLILNIIVNTWIGAKIYRVGILMYGKRPSVKEVFRYLVSY
ncbi:MAG TPA: ABC transporter permease [Limnochordia bacterium]|nr:ABC transporter permease [Limnochordia bacterium]HQD71707.1 ABC transporter permease [Limnochordia bacterium]